MEQRGALAFDRKTAALLAAASEHLPRVLDVVSLADRRELHLEEPAGTSLHALLGARGSLPPGEAVTVLIGAVRAVAALHRAGFCRVRLEPDAVAFDATGRPLLTGTDDLDELIAAGAEGGAADWRAVGALAERLGLLSSARPAGALAPTAVGLGLALASVGGAETDETLARLEDALFELADPAPVQLDPPPARASPRTGSPPPEVPLTRRAARREAAHRRPSASKLIEAFDAGPRALLAEPAARVRARLAALGGRGRMLLVAGGLGGALAVAAVLAMPEADAPAPVSTSGAVSLPSVSGPAASSPSASPPSGSPPSASADETALTGEDPVAAAAVLLTRRDACLQRPAGDRPGCLARIADGAATGLEQPDRPLAGDTPALLERSGDSALIALTPPAGSETVPASALLMWTEAGWRLRQLYEN
jgi:hypothetical protein